MSILKSIIAGKITETEKRAIELRKNITPKQSAAAKKEFQLLMTETADPEWVADRQWKDRVTRCAGDLRLDNAERELADLRATLAADLVQVETRYLVSSEKRLTSPAGFHPDERVFVQPKIAIHTDDLSKIPQSNVPLYIHDMRNLG